VRARACLKCDVSRVPRQDWSRFQATKAWNLLFELFYSLCALAMLLCELADTIPPRNDPCAQNGMTDVIEAPAL
jgi:hypothetical protein